METDKVVAALKLQKEGLEAEKIALMLEANNKIGQIIGQVVMIDRVLAMIDKPAPSMAETSNEVLKDDE